MTGRLIPLTRGAVSEGKTGAASRTQLALAILNHRGDHADPAVRDAIHALEGWTLDDILTDHLERA